MSRTHITLWDLTVIAVNLLVLLSSCAPNDPGIVSLLDQVSPHEPAGPWRIIAFSGGEKPLPEEPSNGDKRQSVSSALRYPVEPRKGSIIMVRLTYPRRFDAGSVVEARLVGEDMIVTKASAELSNNWVELLLRCPDDGVRFLDIVHSDLQGKGVPLKSLIAIEMKRHPDLREVQRARSLMALSSGTGMQDARQVLLRRKILLVRDGNVRNAIVLTGGDTLALALPRRSNSPCLRFWVSGLQVSPGSKSVLKVQVHRHDQWLDLASMPCNELSPLHWRQIDDRVLSGGEAGELRFVFVGATREGVAIGSPILTPETRDGKKKNLIVVDLDTMRADRLGCYGYTKRPTSVRLDSVLQQRGFHVFRNAHSPGSWTLPATAKFLTSRYLNVELAEPRPSECPTLAELLRGNGYYCAAFTGGGILRLNGFERGFHRYAWSEMRNRRLGLGKVEDVFPAMLQWLNHTDLSPFFLFVHTYETHVPYTRDTFCNGLPHGRLGDLTQNEQLLEGSDFRVRTAVQLTWEESLYVQAAYDGCVKKACDATVDLFGLMDALGLWKNSVVIILSDHGEEFWEHSSIFADHHEASLYGEVLRVPFLIYDPDLRNEGVRFWDDDVTTVDLLPTVADLLRVPLATASDGVSLRALMRGRTLERRVPLLSLTYPTTCPKRHWPSRPCIITDGAKYIPLLKGYNGECTGALAYPVEEQLYLLDSDPGETDNRASRMPELKQLLSRRLDEALAAAAQPSPRDEKELLTTDLPADLRKQLEALGYLAQEGE